MQAHWFIFTRNEAGGLGYNCQCFGVLTIGFHSLRMRLGARIQLSSIFVLKHCIFTHNEAGGLGYNCQCFIVLTMLTIALYLIRMGL